METNIPALRIFLEIGMSLRKKHPPALRILVSTMFTTQTSKASKNAPPDSTTTSKPALVSSPTASGLRLTRFSPLYVSLMTPTVSSPYGMGWPRILDS